MNILRKKIRGCVLSIFVFSNLWSQNNAQSDIRQRLLDLYRKFDSEQNHKYARPKISDNSTGGFAWAVSYLMEGYLVMYEATCDTAYMSKFCTYARVVLDNTDTRRGVKDYKGRVRCGWSARSYSEDKASHMVHFVHTGMILYPLLKYCVLYSYDKHFRNGKRYEELYKEIMSIAENCIQQLEPQWRFNSATGQGYYMWEGDEPVKTDLSLQPPLNGQAAMGKSLALLYRLTSKPDYLMKVRALANLFVKNASVTKMQTLRWGYRADTSKARQLEDFSHGAIDVEFALEAWRLKLVELSFIKQLANTLLNLKGKDGFAQYVDGTSRYKDDSEKFIYSLQAGRWLGLSEVNCRVYEAVLGYYLENVASQTALHPSGMLGIANLLKWYDKCLKSSKRIE